MPGPSAIGRLVRDATGVVNTVPVLAYVGAVTAQPCWGVVKTIDVLSPWNAGSETFSQLAPPSVVTKRKCKAPVWAGPVRRSHQIG